MMYNLESVALLTGFAFAVVCDLLYVLAVWYGWSWRSGTGKMLWIEKWIEGPIIGAFTLFILIVLFARVF